MMYHAVIAQQLAAERQRDMLARASRDRLARTARTARSARPATPGPDQALPPAPGLHRPDQSLTPTPVITGKDMT